MGMTGFKYQQTLVPSLDNTHARHVVTTRLLDILLLILLLLVTFSGHPVSAEYLDTKGCHFSIQKAISSENQPFNGEVTRGYVINSLKLVKQISSQDCLPGESYGYTLTSWWAKQGCAAKFKIEECLIAALTPTELTGENPEVNEHYQSSRKHFKFNADSITPSHYPSDRRETVQWGRGDDRKQHPHDVEASGNIHPFTVETKSDTTTARRYESNSSPTLLITTLLLVVALGTYTLL